MSKEFKVSKANLTTAPMCAVKIPLEPTYNISYQCVQGSFEKDKLEGRDTFDSPIHEMPHPVVHSLQQQAMIWMKQNINDGEDCEGCHSTIHTLSSHELAEMVADIIEDIIGD